MKKRKDKNKYRWTNRKEDGTYRTKGYGKSKWKPYAMDACPTCGRKYKYFRAELNVNSGKQTVLPIIIKERDDPNHPRHQVNLNQMLGKMHELKQEAWEAHKQECELMARSFAGEKVSEDEWIEAAKATTDAPGYFCSTKDDWTREKDMYPMFRKEKEKDDEDIPF